MALLLRLVGEPAAVEPAMHVDLQWTAPATCPDAAAVHAAIAAIVVDDARTDGPRPRVFATVRAIEDRFELELVLESSRGSRTRSLAAARCAALVDAVAIECALLIEAEIAARASEPAPREPPPERRDAAPDVVPPAAKPRPAAWRPAWRVRAGASAAASVIANAFVAPTLGAAIVGHRWSSAIDLTHWPAGLAGLPGDPSRGARVSLTTASLGGCGRAAQGRFALAGCGALEVGALVARGVGLDGARRVGAATVATTLGPVVEVGLGRRVVAVVAPWIRVALRRPGISVDGVGEVARLRAWAFGATLRLEVEIVGRKRRPRGIPVEGPR